MPQRSYRLPIAIAATLALGGVVPGARAAPSTGFLSKPTDQISVPGLLAGAEITPEGDLYTGWAEYELRFGRRLTAWYQPTRTLPNPALPLLASTLWDGPVSYTQTIFAVAVAGRPVAYETVTVSNHSSAPQVAKVAMAMAYTRGRKMRGAHLLPTRAYRYERPASGQRYGFYTQPGQAFSRAFRYTARGRDLLRSGLLLARGPAAASRPLATPARFSPSAPHDARLFTKSLAAYGRTSFTWQIPLEPPGSGAGADWALDRMPRPRALGALQRTWRAQEAGMMQIDVPEAKVRDAYRAAIVEMLSSRYRTPAGWVQASNKLQYQAFWIRDGALETQALDMAGLHAPAAQDLAFMDTFQEASGLFISRAGQYDGLGQALWALGRHAELTRDPVYAAAQLSRIAKAIGWLAAASAHDPLGLLPVGAPHDNELAEGHITGDDLWAAAGLRSAVADARLAGRADLAATWQTIDARFEAALDRALAAAVARAGHIPPVLDSGAGQDWGNYSAAYPVQVLPANSPEVAATMAWARLQMAEGIATYSHRASLHDYLGFSVFETELAAGDVRDAVAGLYTELAHTTSTDEGWEWDVAPFGTRASAINLAPHGTFAADYVALLRNLLLSEDASGGLDLLAGASPAWLAPGRHITVSGASTSQGTISFTEHSHAHSETLKWHSSLEAGAALTWTLPAGARNVRVAGTTGSGAAESGITEPGAAADAPPASSSTSATPRRVRIALRGSSGSLTVTFDGNPSRQSYAQTVAALDAAYRARGRAAPIVPSGR